MKNPYHLLVQCSDHKRKITREEKRSGLSLRKGSFNAISQQGKEKRRKGGQYIYLSIFEVARKGKEKLRVFMMWNDLFFLQGGERGREGPSIFSPTLVKGGRGWK